MKTIPILSICIPTFNRSVLLQDCLESIILSMGSNFTSNEVEIIISDNCSTDNTSEIAIEFSKKFSFIKYFKNEHNVLDLNFFLAAKRSKGKYIWVFGDDDVFLPNTLSIIFCELNKNLALIISNYSLWNHDLSICLKESFLGLNTSKLFNDHNLLMKTFGLRLAFISCIIIRRDKLLSFEQRIFTENVFTGFPYLLAIYFSQINSCNALYLSNPIFMQRGNLKHASIEWWYTIFLTGSNHIFNLLCDLGYDRLVVDFSKLNVLNNDIKNDIFYRKIHGQNIFFIWKNLIKTYRKFPLNLVFILILVLTPSFIFRILYNFRNVKNFGSL